MIENHGYEDHKLLSLNKYNEENEEVCNHFKLRDSTYW